MIFFKVSWAYTKTKDAIFCYVQNLLFLININIYHRIQWVSTLSEEEELLTEDLEQPSHQTAT